MDLAKFMEQKEKIRKAQALYEPWMDNKKVVEQNDEILQTPQTTPTQLAYPKHRSEFVFDNEYVKTVTCTPNSVDRIGTVRNTHNDTLNDEKTSIQSAMPLSRNSSVSIYLPPSESLHQPTPLPIDERRECCRFVLFHSIFIVELISQYHNLVPFSTLKTFDCESLMTHNGHCNVLLCNKIAWRLLAINVIIVAFYLNNGKPKRQNNNAPPPSHIKKLPNRDRRSVSAEADTKKHQVETEKLLIEGGYADFYAWVLNGDETDLTTANILRLLFGKVTVRQSEVSQQQ